MISKSQPGLNGEQTSLIQRVPVKALIDTADPDANIRLSGGEEVRVPEAGKVFIVGNENSRLSHSCILCDYRKVNMKGRTLTGFAFNAN